MKRISFLLMPLVFVLSGCIDTRNPIVTVRSFGLSVLENNLKDFRATLGKSIREEWGTQEKLDSFKLVLAPHEKLQVGPAVLTRVEQGYQGWNYWGDVKRFFTETLEDQTTGEIVMNFEVVCAVWVDQISNSSGNCAPNQPNCNDQYQYVENQDCRITKLAL